MTQKTHMIINEHGYKQSTAQPICCHVWSSAFRRFGGKFSRSLMMAAKATGIGFFDHIIIGDNRYFSFADEGLIEEYEMRAIREL